MTRHLLVAPVLLMAFTSLAASQATPQRIRLGAPYMNDQIVQKVAPAYPPLARQAHIQGTVILRAQINKIGDVESLQLVSGHPMLAPAAIEAVKQWKYKPYLLNGEAVDVETNVIVNFTLSDKPPTEGVAGDVPGGIPEGEKGGIVPSTDSDAPHPAVPGRVRVSAGLMTGLLAKKASPQYPIEARDQRIQGLVVLKADIDKEGNISNLQIVSGHPLLAPAAIEAVKQWKYKPFLLNGEPREVETQILVTFTLAK